MNARPLGSRGGQPLGPTLAAGAGAAGGSSWARWGSRSRAWPGAAFAAALAIRRRAAARGTVPAHTKYERRKQ